MSNKKLELFQLKHDRNGYIVILVMLLCFETFFLINFIVYDNPAALISAILLSLFIIYMIGIILSTTGKINKLSKKYEDLWKEEKVQN